eukprot:PhM_4_TR2449/c1_g1_i3/m.12657
MMGMIETLSQRFTRLEEEVAGRGSNRCNNSSRGDGRQNDRSFLSGQLNKSVVSAPTALRRPSAVSTRSMQQQQRARGVGRAEPLAVAASDPLWGGGGGGGTRLTTNTSFDDTASVVVQRRAPSPGGPHKNPFVGRKK